jgi:DHA1 family tetracycline resistance protein-like MFS transporter
MAWRKLPEPERRGPARARRMFDFGALRHAFSTATLPLILLLSVVATFCFANFEGTLARLTKARWDYDIQANGFIFTYVGFCLLVAQGFVVRRLMGRVGESRFVVSGCVLLAGGLAGIGWQWPPLLILPVAVLGFSMLSPSLSSLLSRRTPAHMQGEIMGLNQSGLALARILGPYAGNIWFDLSPETPFWIAAAIMGAAFVASLRLLAPAPADR